MRAARATRLAAATAAAAVVALAACKASEEPFVAYDYAVTDPPADTLAHEDGASRYPSLDVTGVAGSVTAASIVVRLTFTQPVAPWTAQSASSVDGFLDFDIDENSQTGVPGAASDFGGNAPLGSEYYVELRDDGAGHVAMRSTSSPVAPFVAVPATWNGSTLELTIPRSVLHDRDGQFRLSVMVGNRDLDATDFAPSDGYYTIHR